MNRFYNILYTGIFLLLSLYFFQGCDNTPEFIKRDKLTFLYKLITNASIIREETFSISNVKQAGYHSKKLNKYIKELVHFNPVDNWKTSEELLIEYEGILRLNLTDAQAIIDSGTDENLLENDVTERMKIRLDEFIRKLYKHTTEVDSE